MDGGVDDGQRVLGKGLAAALHEFFITVQGFGMFMLKFADLHFAVAFILFVVVSFMCRWFRQ